MAVDVMYLSSICALIGLNIYLQEITNVEGYFMKRL